MNQEEQWLLPDGVEEILPRQAIAVETLRRKLLDQFASWGYQLVFPPLVEFLESLLNGAGRDLEQDTVKVTDRLSGRLMGVRPDITPQVARMDAHSLRDEGPSRLCYCSTALRASVSQPSGSRLPYQVGVELFGHAGFESDAEVVELLVESIMLAGAQQITLELGHVGIFKAVVNATELDDAAVETLSNIYLRKAVTELDEFLAAQQLPDHLRELLRHLPRLCGDVTLLESAREQLACVPDALHALADLQALVSVVQQQYPAITLYLDLAELRGYHYHTGCVFAAYLPGSSEPVAKGGRYDHIGEVFGRARPASGFSADLKALAALSTVAVKPGILVRGDSRQPALKQAMKDLRAQGDRVILALPGVTNDIHELDCNRYLQLNENGQPQIISNSDSE